MSAREAAMLTLAAMDRQKAWSDGYLDKVIREEKLDRRDAALATRLCLGVLQNQMLLDHYLQHHSAMKLEKMERKVLANLRVGLYQLLFLTKVPPSAAVSEAVELTKRHAKNPRAAGMVNGILRSLLRHMDALPPLEQDDKTAYLSLLYSHPRWLVEAWQQRLSPTELETLLQWDNGEPPITVQVNLCRATCEETIAALEAEEVTVFRHPWLTDCLVLTGTGDLTERWAWKEGMLYVQDPAAKLAVLAAAPTPGQQVLDACAAPGGKSFAAAIAMKNEGRITACDIHAHKKAVIQEGANRLGLSCITAQVTDGKKYKKAWEGAFDTVLADVPCSGLGVIRKKPEIRYKKPEELAGLPAVQRDILGNVSRYVRPGGVLLYSTCTLLAEENEAVAAWFLQTHPDFHAEAFTLPGPVGHVESGQCTLWPQKTETDGFFLARFRREEGPV